MDHTKLSGRVSVFSPDSTCQTHHFSLCPLVLSEPFSFAGLEASVASAAWRPGLCWGSCRLQKSVWWLKMEITEWEKELSPKEHRGRDELFVLSTSNGHGGHLILSSLWSGPLLLRVTGRRGLHSQTPNGVCAGLTGSLLLPWWPLSLSDDPFESYSDASLGEPVRSHSLAFFFYI